jgi:hypothetical protein
MKLSSVCLFVALAVYVNADIRRGETRTKTEGRGDITGSMREGWKRLKEMTGKSEDKTTTTTTTTSIVSFIKTTLINPKYKIKNL